MSYKPIGSVDNSWTVIGREHLSSDWKITLEPSSGEEMPPKTYTIATYQRRNATENVYNS